MKLIGLVLLFVNASLAASPQAFPFKVRPVIPRPKEVHHRIYDGLAAAEGQFPFMILSLMRFGSSKYSKCSSSLISPDWVLLAAHCVSFPSLRPRDILLIGGKANLLEYITERVNNNNFNTPINETLWGLQERRAKNFFKHPLYSDSVLQHDVALIQLTQPFRLDGAVQTIPLSTEKITSPKTCTILGWGLARENIDLQNLNYIENKKVSTAAMGCRLETRGGFICLAQDGGGICRGDSGSPLVCEGKVWGVASHYVSPTEDSDCWDSLEEYYSELYPDLGWIKSVYGAGNLSTFVSWRTLLSCLLASLWLSAKR